MKFSKCLMSLCLLMSIAACGESNSENRFNNNDPGTGNNNPSPPAMQAAGSYDLIHTNRSECGEIFDAHIQVRQNGSQITIQTNNSTAAGSVAPNNHLQQSFADALPNPSSNPSSSNEAHVNSIQGSIDSQGYINLSGTINAQGESVRFQCSGRLVENTASISCQISGETEQGCYLRYQKRSSESPSPVTVPDTNPGSNVPLTDSSEQCEIEYTRISSTDAECNNMLGSQIFIQVDDNLIVRTTGERPQSLGVYFAQSGQLHLERPQGRFYSEDCGIIFTEDLSQIEFHCSAWERAGDPPSCTVIYRVNEDPTCLAE